MKIKKTAAATVGIIGAAAAAIAVGATAVGASTSTGYSFVGWAGGSLVRAANNTITSDLTAASSINYEAPASDTNSAAAVQIPNLLTAGALNTSTVASSIDGGYQVVSTAQTTGINALGGLIKASAIKTISVAKVVNGVASAATHTEFINLTVGTVHVPVNVAPNTVIRIPNVATVALNYQLAFAKANKSFNIGAGAYVSLLKPFGSNAVGAELALSPTYAALAPVVTPESGRFLYAKAYGTQVTAHVGSLVGIRSDPTAPISMPAAGTPNGAPQTSSIASVNLSPAAAVGAISDSVAGTNTTSVYDSFAQSKIAGVNLFNGLIKAEALTASARVNGATASAAAPTVTTSSSLVNLIINGHRIAINTAPNTTVKLLNIATVTINQQVKSATAALVRALDIKLTTAAYGFPAGAEIQVATAIVSAS